MVIKIKQGLLMAAIAAVSTLPLILKSTFLWTPLDSDDSPTFWGEHFNHAGKSMERNGNTKMKTRRLSGTGNEVVYADWVYSSSTGSFWLPRPPPKEKLIGGYEVRPRDVSSSSYHPSEYDKPMYEGKDGFVLDDHVRIMMSQTFNAGDFYACFVSPMIAGRPVSLRDGAHGDRMSLSVVGSILDWGIRYIWGSGFIREEDTANGATEIVFATRGPRSYEKFKATMAQGSTIHKAYGDPGLLLSWFYQPHRTAKQRNTPFV